MSQLGIGTMLHILGGGSELDPKDYYGKKIVGIEMKDDRLNMAFSDGTGISLRDDGQSCCEHRYMTTDDDISELVGKSLHLIEVKRHEEKDGEYGDPHEQAFVEIQAIARTKISTITIVNHNEHNGYYGGFGLNVTKFDGIISNAKDTCK